MSRRADLDHVLFLGAYLLCVTEGMLIGYSTFSALPHTGTLALMMRACAAGLILIKLILDRHYDFGLLIRLLLMGLILLISYVKSGYSHVFYLLVIFLGMRFVDERTVVRVDLTVRFALTVLIVICGLTGITENYITYRTGSTVLRYSVGFNHPNTLASMVLSLFLEEAWLNRRKANGFYIVFVWCVSAAVYFLTANRTAVLIMMAYPTVLFLVQIWRKRDPEHRKSGYLFAAMLLLMTVFSFAVMKHSRSNAMFSIFDKALSNRFYNANVIYKSYGISLLGQQVELVSVKTARLLKSSIALLDVAYLRLLIQAGPVVVLLMACLYGKTMKASWACGDRLSCFVFSVFIIFGLCESGFNNVVMNFTIILIAKSIFETDGLPEPEYAL